MLTPVFSQSLITFDVDTTEFVAGEIVELTGHVDAGLEGQPVGVEIKDANGNIILIRTVTSDSNGDFTLKFKVPSTVTAGAFDISTNVELDGQSFSGVQSSESTELEYTQEPTFEPEPTSDPVCGAGTMLKDGICVVDTTRTISETHRHSSTNNKRRWLFNCYGNLWFRTSTTSTTVKRNS